MQLRQGILQQEQQLVGNLERIREIKDPILLQLLLHLQGEGVIGVKFIADFFKVGGPLLHNFLVAPSMRKGRLAS